MSPKRDSDRWHATMYDEWFASTTLGSAAFRRLARHEAAFLVSALGLKRGDHVLDVPCGAGRHSAALARAGLAVTGVDINEECLRLARATCLGTGARLEAGDMGRLGAHRDQFDAVVNLFTSFGYFATDARNERVLRELVSTLKPGGRIALHVVNRDWLLSVFKPVSWREEKGKLILETRTYDPKTRYNDSQMVVIDRRTAKAKIYHHRIRLYAKSELVALFKRCGLKQIRVYGDFDGGPFSRLKSTHPIYVGRKG
jgi:2-polyprenyl-3-methyl-5-hydroxy-6-metoxy-1,4-benzoquinol methylase